MLYLYIDIMNLRSSVS